MSLGFPEIIIILFVILLLFGARKLPDLARGLGQGMREFKKAANDIQDEIKSAGDVTEPPKKVQEKTSENKEEA